MHVLVVYGSKRGGTAGLAEMIGDALVADGLTVPLSDGEALGCVKHLLTSPFELPDAN